MKRVNQVLVGTNISSTAAVKVNVNGVADTIAAGEIVVLDKNKQLLAAGSTITDSDTIYICQGQDDTFTDANGLSRRNLKYSAPIEGRKVRSFLGRQYAAASQSVATFSATWAASAAPVVGDEYILRIVYKDFQSETPAQYIKEYRAFAATTTISDLYTQFRTKITADTGARIAGTGTTTLILTGIAIPFVVGNIDPYKIVTFEAFLNHVDPSNQIPETAGATVTYTGGNPGVGVWQQVHDLEKAAKAYEGVTNYIHFPVPSRIAQYDTDSTLTYDFITIDSDLTYASPDNNYDKEAKLNTVIALPSAAGQIASLLAQLNPWMASTPKAFTPVVI